MNSHEPIRAAILPHLKSGDWLTLLFGDASVVLLAINLWNGGLNC